MRAVREEIGAAAEWLHEASEALGVPAAQCHRLDMCLDEVLANIVSHGGPTALDGDVLLTLQTQTEEGQRVANLLVSDLGMPFNPLLAPEKPLALSLDDAEPGGLGLVMMKRYADALGYRHVQGRNELSVTVRWSE
jgi:anti-sigma regulatory factor (Ser/Thr protein kinase)